LFNDAALNGAAAAAKMLAAGRRLGVEGDPRPRAGGRHFSDTGLIVWHGAPWSVFFDAGDVGPDVQPGHAHADTLSLECSFRGRRLFVDPGTCAYDRDARRRYDRSTAAHNTVTIDGRDSSEVWHIFRVGARALPRDVRAVFTPAGLVAMAAHDGYETLRGRVRHRRTVVVEGNELRIVDRITGAGEHLVEGGWLLAPEWRAAAVASGWVLSGGNAGPACREGLGLVSTTPPVGPSIPPGRRDVLGRVRLSIAGPHDLQLAARPAAYHPEFGRELTTTRLGWRYFGRLPIEVTTVCDSAGAAPEQGR
ncbi:MAG TPA: heparinase II/III-family protein, partial [Planctomycetaceae bacterium]|nr:heparinase II/III-family protein [Planctomycetaceae bacterium]